MRSISFSFPREDSLERLQGAHQIAGGGILELPASLMEQGDTEGVVVLHAINRDFGGPFFNGKREFVRVLVFDAVGVNGQ